MSENEKILKSVTSGGTLIIYLDGDIDHHNARAVRQRIDSKMFIGRPRELVLDLSRVAFMDSSGLGLILGRYTKAAELGISFRVVNPNRQIRKILDLAGMERLVRIETTSAI
ncbi:MAG: STAS domain-containing protein [Ruminococcaceae bacterium]|nr:STAS domain-containing protein [Oscillospiraceae bacterium]